MIISYSRLSDVAWYAYPSQDGAGPESSFHYGLLKHLGVDLAIRRTTFSRKNGTRMPDVWELSPILKSHRKAEGKTEKRLAEMPTKWKKFTPYCRWQSFIVDISSPKRRFQQRGVVNLDEVTFLCSPEKMLYLHIESKPYRKHADDASREWDNENGWSVLADYYSLSSITGPDGLLKASGYLSYELCSDGQSSSWARVWSVSPRIKYIKDGSPAPKPWR